jgi:hypothetical protein
VSVCTAPDGVAAAAADVSAVFCSRLLQATAATSTASIA